MPWFALPEVSSGLFSNFHSETRRHAVDAKAACALRQTRKIPTRRTNEKSVFIRKQTGRKSTFLARTDSASIDLTSGGLLPKRDRPFHAFPRERDGRNRD